MAFIDPSLRARIFLIADDLTGACDSAVAFAKGGSTTEILLDSNRAADPGVEVCAIVTGTRDVPAELAAETLQRLARNPELLAFQQIFKKVDSVFRGNTFHEIHAAIQAFPAHFAVIAPAYPALGRTSSDRVLKIRDTTGESSIAVADRLQSIGVQPTWIAAGQSVDEVHRQMRESHADHNRPVFCDANTDNDLQTAVLAARKMGARKLWIGSAGLAHALATDLCQAPPASPLNSRPRKTGVVLIFAGSNHPVTRQQISALRNQHAILEWTSSSAASPLIHDASTVFFSVERGRTTEHEIRLAMANFDPRDISCLVMTGGDTAMLVCRALGIESIFLESEFAPGLPQGLTAGGDFPGLPIVLKSGGFGNREVLSEIATQFSQKAERV